MFCRLSCTLHFCLTFAPCLISWLGTAHTSQAIDVLEDMLDNGLKEGAQNMFAAKEYVQIYT